VPKIPATNFRMQFVQSLAQQKNPHANERFLFIRGAAI